MRTRDPATHPDAGSTILALALVGAFFAVSLVRAFRGHSQDWFTWTLLLMVASSVARPLVVGSRWRVPLRLVYVVSGIATATGLLLAVLHDWTA